MQLQHRYLVNNRSTVIMNDTGFITEYKPVYAHQMKLTKGIDNILQFRFLNADQKPVDVSGETVKFVAYDEQRIKVLDIVATALSTTGLVKVDVSKDDLSDLPQQYLKYVLFLDDGSTQTLSFSDSHLSNNGIIYLDSSVFPAPRDDVELVFSAVATALIPDEDKEDGIDYWASDHINATPSGEDFSFENAIIVTPPIASDELTIQYTTDKQIVLGSKWIDITPSDVSSDSTETRFEFNGIYNNLRVYVTEDPENITKIILRN